MKKDVNYQRKHFNKNVNIPDKTYVDKLILNDRINFIISEINPDYSVLDLGCGNGHITKSISSYVKKIIGVDFSKESIKLANQKKAGKNIEYIISSIDELPFKNNFDTVILCEVIEHVENPNYLVKKIKQYLVNNGKFIITTPNRKRIFNRLRVFFNKEESLVSESHVKEFSYGELKELLEKNGFEIISYKGSILGPTTYLEKKKIPKFIIKILHNLGKIFPSFATYIFVSCKKIKGDNKK